MQKEIHPKVYAVKATCTCGNSFETKSTDQELHVTLCSGCHPYFTGQQKYVDTAGRIDKFNKKYNI